MALGTPSWLNLDFVERILRSSENDSSIRLIDIEAKAATSKGDNYTSDMIRVSAEFSRGNDERREKRSIILKVSPMEGLKKEVLEKAKLFDTELSMMSNTLKKMHVILGQKYKLNARLLYLREKDPTVLAMEDLATLGFRMADRQAGLDLDHSLLALQRLAKFHASTVALCEKEPKQKELYAKGIFHEEQSDEIKHFFTSNMQHFTEVAKGWPELDARYVEKLQKLSDRLYDMGTKSAKRTEGSFNVINHGDFWVNNMLFRYDDKGKPIDHIFVDFQLSVYTTPVVDLSYFLSTSVNETVLTNHKDRLLQHYFSTLTDTMRELGCKTSAPTFEELQREMKDRANLGMICSFSILPFILVDKSDAMDINELLDVNGGYTNPGLRSNIFRKVITARIVQYDEMGLLDP